MTSVGVGALVLAGNDSAAEAHRLIERVSPLYASKIYILAKTGDSIGARRQLEELDAERPQPWMAESIRGFAYLGLGDTAKALSALERATDNREIWPLGMQVIGPAYDSIRGSARFQALLRRVGLAPP
jgi:hypothetical protein